MNRSSVASVTRVFWLWAALMTCVVRVWAQEPTPSPATYAITLQASAPVSSPSSALRRLMEANGLGGTYAGFFGSTDYLDTQTLPSLGLRVEFFRPRASIGGALQFTGGRVLGRYSTRVRWQAVSLAPLYSYYSRLRTTRISAGPSLQWVQTEAGEELSSKPFSKKTGVVPGLMVDAALRFPARSTFFVELGARYEAAFGQLHNSLSYSTGSGVPDRTLPYDLRLNRLLVHVGFGLRLGAYKPQRSVPGKSAT